jgi:hypothetical protein
LSNREVSNSHPTSAISTDTTNFNNNLSSTDIDVQTALTTLDNLNNVKNNVNQTSHSFVVGDVIRRSSGSYIKAIATSKTNAKAVGIVSTVVDADNFIVVYKGNITVSTASWADGTVYYLSDATAGALTSTAPTTFGSVEKAMLVATGTTTGIVFTDTGALIQRVQEVEITSINPDDTYPPDAGTDFGCEVSTRFLTTANSIGYFAFNKPQVWSASKDVKIAFDYKLSSTPIASDVVKFTLDYSVCSSGEVPNLSSPDVSVSESIAVSAIDPTAFIDIELSTIKIASAQMASGRQRIFCKLTRDVSVANNYGGSFDLISIRLYQD